jgi:uncharacterized protein YjiS (DUF1127 family)
MGPRMTTFRFAGRRSRGGRTGRQGLHQRIRASRDGRAAERALLQLSDHQLQDIGLSRSQAHAVAFGLLSASTSGRPDEAPNPAAAAQRRTSGWRRPVAAALAGLALLVGLTATTDTESRGLPTVADLPPGTIKVSPPVPGMGEHWANPKDLPLGPIYCVMDGKVICAEFMIVQEAFIRGKSFERLRLGMKGKLPPVDHLEITFMPHGHEGFEVPHYDVHMYFVPPEARPSTQATQ